MTFLVQAPLRFTPERRYVLDVLLGEWLGLSWRLVQEERSDVRISLDGGTSGHAVVLPEVLFAVDEHTWLQPASLPAGPLATAAPGPRWSPYPHGGLPVLYGVAGAPAVEASADGTQLRLGVDVLGSVFAMLTRYEELVVAERDGFGRFPASASIAGREGLLGVALADAYLELLWRAFESMWPGLRRKARTYAVLISHDVDDPLSTLGRTPAGVARQFVGDLLQRRDPALAGRRLRALAGARRGEHDADPHNTFPFLLDVSERHGLRSAVHFQAHERMSPASGARYAIDHPFVRRLLREVQRRGHEVGYHGGLGTHEDLDRTRAELERLRDAVSAAGGNPDIRGGRQHYLQWSTGTWRIWDELGLAYDASVGYADAAGFRTGTSHEFPVFDLRGRRPLGLREQPFQVMDVTLVGYMALVPDEAAAVALDIARECHRFGGAVGVLWHNDTLRRERERRWYEELVAQLVAVG